MKCIIVFYTLLVIIYGFDEELLKEVQKEVMAKGRECVLKLRASHEDVEKLLKKEIPTSHTGMCVVSCVQKKFGVQDEDGKINTEAALNAFEIVKEIDVDVYEKTKPAVQKCISEASYDGDECTTAVKLATCGKAAFIDAGYSYEMFNV